MTRPRFLLIFLGIAAFVSLSYFWFAGSRFRSIDSLNSELNGLISAERIEKQMVVLASVPHRAGTEANQRVGDAILRRLKESGLEVSTVEYPVDLPEPVESRLFLTFPEAKELSLRERALQEDSFSQVAEAEIPFFAYSPECDLEADVVYANFGEKKDYALLKQHGIDVAGKIALVRAQGICRGMKAWVAEQEGIAGLLVYPELRDQGFRKPSFPQGPNLNPWVVQRGSLLKFFLYPGDPQPAALAKIPALPVTPEIAMQILDRIQGIPSPPEWQGWLSVPYNIGSGPGRVRMVYRDTHKSRMIRNVFATIAGTNTVEPSVLTGTHYDAWVYGASDPCSGAAVILETADALAQLVKKGWKPRRAIRFAFWDAEEYGMIGSTRWVQENLGKLRKGFFAMVYVDSIRGPLFGGYVMPGLRGVLDEVLGKVQDPGTQKSVTDLHSEYEMPGFSSDTIPFTGLVGIPVAQLNYGTHYPMYHSVYDDLQWMGEFGDPGYHYSANMARILALYLAQLAGSEMLPYHFDELSSNTLQLLTKLQIDQPNLKKLPSFSALLEEVRRFQGVATRLNETVRSHREIPDERTATINAMLQQAILSFTVSEGELVLRNTLVGPSQENLCAGIGLPGLQKALNSQSESEAEAQTVRLIQAFSRARSILLEAEKLLR